LFSQRPPSLKTLNDSPEAGSATTRAIPAAAAKKGQSH